MPSNATAKTKWALKRRQTVILLIAAAILAVAVLMQQHSYHNGRVLSIGGHTYHLELATTQRQQERGLAGRASLASDRGMLFIYPREKKTCFWMKGMRFPVDMVWADADHQVVYIARNVSPDTYPQTICPSDPASYVIELKAGQVAEAGIRLESVLEF